jgi:hypothetical protein
MLEQNATGYDCYTASVHLLLQSVAIWIWIFLSRLKSFNQTQTRHSPRLVFSGTPSLKFKEQMVTGKYKPLQQSMTDSTPFSVSFSTDLVQFPSYDVC